MAQEQNNCLLILVETSSQFKYTNLQKAPMGILGKPSWRIGGKEFGKARDRWEKEASVYLRCSQLALF